MGQKNPVIAAILCCFVMSGLVSANNIVFVTSTLQNGNLGGLAGADAVCQARAVAGGLLGKYTAWLSDSTRSVSTRMIHSSAPYQLPVLGAGGGEIVANNWADLTDGTIAFAITRTESGAAVAANFAWTGSNANGSGTGFNCNNWTSIVDPLVGTVGQTNLTNSSWTNNGNSLGLFGQP